MPGSPLGPASSPAGSPTSAGSDKVEARTIHRAGLASGPWQAIDQTGTRVDGQNHTCHVLGNRVFTSDHTRAGGTRQDVLAVLWGQDPVFRLDDDALLWLAATVCALLVANGLPNATSPVASQALSTPFPLPCCCRMPRRPAAALGDSLIARRPE